MGFDDYINLFLHVLEINSDTLIMSIEDENILKDMIVNLEVLEMFKSPKYIVNFFRKYKKPLLEKINKIVFGDTTYYPIYTSEYTLGYTVYNGSVFFRGYLIHKNISECSINIIIDYCKGMHYETFLGFIQVTNVLNNVQIEQVLRHFLKKKFSYENTHDLAIMIDYLHNKHYKDNCTQISPVWYQLLMIHKGVFLDQQTIYFYMNENNLLYNSFHQEYIHVYCSFFVKFSVDTYDHDFCNISRIFYIQDMYHNVIHNTDNMENFIIDTFFYKYGPIIEDKILKIKEALVVSLKKCLVIPPEIGSIELPIYRENEEGIGAFTSIQAVCDTFIDIVEKQDINQVISYFDILFPGQYNAIIMTMILFSLYTKDNNSLENSKYYQSLIDIINQNVYYESCDILYSVVKNILEPFSFFDDKI
jgi:hypothetical protein